MAEREELAFEFRIQAVERNGRVSFEPAIFNQGVLMEHIITMLHSWLRNVETAYDEDFKRYS